MAAGVTAATLLTACDHEEHSLAPANRVVKADPPLSPPDPAAGLQLAISGKVSAGSERTICSFYRVPEGGFDVVEFEHRRSGPSHHSVVYQTAVTPERAAEYRGVFDCVAAADFGMDVGSVFYGSQDPSGSVRLPEGVASRATAGQMLLLEFHLMNAAQEEEEAEARLNLFYAPEPPRATAGSLFFVSMHIWVPPLGTSSSTMRCEIPKDLRLFRAGSHMHRRGIGFRSSVERGDLGSRSPLYESGAWDTSVPEYFAEPLLLRQGDVVEFTCDYENPDPVGVPVGFSAETNEMCIFNGKYFTDDGSLLTSEQEWCRMLPGTQGTGTQSCSTLDACVEARMNSAPTEDQNTEYQLCALQACPGESLGLFDALERCRLAHCVDSCGSLYAPAGPDGRKTVSFSAAACQACEAENCPAERDVCDAHVCQ